MGRKKTRVSLEQYLSFYENPWHFDLTLPLLNQIISMHGFLKLHHHHKRDIIATLDSIDLIPPTRSTLGQSSVSSSAFLTTEQVRKDLDALDWNECPIHTIQTLEPSWAHKDEKDFLGPSMVGSDPPFISSSSSTSALRRPPPVDFEIKGKRARSKRKLISVNALTTSSPSVSSSAYPPPPLPSSPPPSPPPLPSSPPPPLPSSPPPTTPPPPSYPPPPWFWF